jgi:trafficking protein particle complex subunit 13
VEQQEEDDPSSVARQQRILLPPPEPITPSDEKRHENLKLRGATRFLGASTLLVPPITLVVPTPADSSVSSSGDRDGKREDGRVGGTAAATKRGEGFWDFELEYAPLRTGFVPVGGLRMLLLEDQVDGAAEAAPSGRPGTSDPPVVLREWDVIGEIWVKS